MPPDSPSSTDGAGRERTIWVCDCGYWESHTRPDGRCRNWQSESSVSRDGHRPGAHVGGPFDAPRLRPVKVVETSALEALRERTRVLEEAHHHVLTLIDRLRTDDEMGPCIDAIQRVSLAAVAVEDDEPKFYGWDHPADEDDGYERPPAAGGTASQGADAEETLRRIMAIPTPAGNEYADQVWSAIRDEPESAAPHYQGSSALPGGTP